MKVTSEEQKITPIRITLETYEEAAALMALCGEVYGNLTAYRQATDNLYDHFKSLNIEAAKIRATMSGVEFK